MQIPWPAALAGTMLAAVGAAGLIRAAVPPAPASGNPSAAGAIVVTNAYVREPAPPTDEAAAYFTVFNTTGKDDTLLSVTSGAGATSTLHTLVRGVMTPAANGARVPAHGSLVLSTGTGHVMIQQLFGKLLPGQSVNLELSFTTAGPIDVAAKVIALGAPPPTGSSAATSNAATSTGATN